MWGIEHWGVEPEIMTMAKGIANGLPLGVTICTPEIAAALKALTISTFGGNPVSCAAANATVQFVEEESLPANAETMGRLLRGGLEELKRRFPKNLGDVRGMGLMQAVEFVVDETAGDRTPEKQLTNRIFEEARTRGLLIGKGGLEGNAFRIAPPLTVNASEVNEALAILRESFEAAGAS
jgi:4-aminobutyrate aminotransferase-like enzyme